MKCALCDGNIVKKKDILLFKSKILGEVYIPNIDFEECESCGDKLFSPESSEKISSYIRQEEQCAIGMMPIEAFITATEAAALLEITKQAFSKNNRVKRGLIYSVTKGNNKLYLKESVELFKEKNNGKFLLPNKERYDQTETTKPEIRYIIVEKTNIIPKDVYKDNPFIKNILTEDIKQKQFLPNE